MRKKRVWRYYCEFCKKAGCSKWHMEKHEKSCTKNPNRICRICHFADLTQKPMSELITIVKKYEPENLEDMMKQSELSEKMTEELSDFVEGCPACMLAAVRQSESMLYIDYEKRRKIFWDAINEDKQEQSYRQDYY